MPLENVDWSKLPRPENDGAADHLIGARLPSTLLHATDGSPVTLATLPGLAVIYAYPMTGRPDVAAPENWDMIPGAKGCTPQSCAFRDHFVDLRKLGVGHVFGLSTQSTDYQKEAANRLHLPFPLLSDSECRLTDALALPTMTVEGKRLTKRLTMITRDGVIMETHYPVFPPDQDAQNVIAWLKARAV